MLINTMLTNKEDSSIKIRFNSNSTNNLNGNGFNKSNKGFDYQASLLSKKRKLEIDLKNGNINNFNKVLNNAVMNSSRNNENELIPNKIEFKLSHILKGEKKIVENSNADLADFNYNENNSKNINSAFSESLLRNESSKLSVLNGFEKKNSKDNKVNINNISKGNDSDNTSDVTKTSSVENMTINNSNTDKAEIEMKPALSNVNLNPARSELDQLSHSTQKQTCSLQLNLQNSNQNRQASRKNSFISNNSDKQNKSHKNQVFHDNYVDTLLEWKKPTHVGSGLNNMGNTCFLNSVLQSLLYTPGLINYFVFSEHKKKCNPKGLCLMCEFNCLVELSKANRLGSLTPKNILNNIKFISKNIKIGRQEDAHEFLLYLLDGLEKACKNFVGTIKNNFIVSGNVSDDNLIQKLFGGKLASCVICLKCKNVSKKVDQYLDISIDIYNSDSIHRSLKNFCKPESLSGSNKFYCESCKTKNDSLKKFSFENFPRVLVLHLKRFDNFQRKIKKFIEYPADLDLTNFSENKSEKYKYRLYGVLVHEGSTISWGHYYCYIKNSNELWYCMNDSHVSQTTLKNVLNQTPYLLFYERVIDKKPEIASSMPNLINRKISAEINNANNLALKKSVSNANVSLEINNKNSVLNKEINQGKVDLFEKQTIREKEFVTKDYSQNNQIKLNDDKVNKNESNNLYLHKDKSKEKINSIPKSEDNKSINKFDEKSKEFNKDLKANNKSEITVKDNIIKDNIINILNIPRKNSDTNLTIKKQESKKSISELKYDLNENLTDKPKEDKVCMGINEIKKALLFNKEILDNKNINSEKTKLFLDENDKHKQTNNINMKESKEVNFDLIKCKTSFEMKMDLCDKIDEKETHEIKKNMNYIDNFNTLSLRSSNKKSFISRKFKRLMSIFAKFGNTKQQDQANKGILFNSYEKEIEKASKPILISSLELNESPIEETKNNKIISKIDDESNKLEQTKYVKKDSKIINNIHQNQTHTQNSNELESEAPTKKRIFNTKINEIYHGRFIERWEDDEDDENELNKLRTQADFVRKSDAFKKQKLLRKSRYDMDYDAGKQKKVRIYDEKESKGKNVFQKQHSTMLNKIKKGADPKKLIENQSLNFQMRRKDKKFKNRNRDNKFSGNNRDNRNSKFGKFDKFNKYNKFGNKNFGGKRFDRNDNWKGGKFKGSGNKNKY